MTSNRAPATKPCHLLLALAIALPSVADAQQPEPKGEASVVWGQQGYLSSSQQRYIGLGLRWRPGWLSDGIVWGLDAPLAAGGTTYLEMPYGALLNISPSVSYRRRARAGKLRLALTGRYVFVSQDAGGIRPGVAPYDSQRNWMPKIGLVASIDAYPGSTDVGGSWPTTLHGQLGWLALLPYQTNLAPFIPPPESVERTQDFGDVLHALLGATIPVVGPLALRIDLLFQLQRGYEELDALHAYERPRSLSLSTRAGLRLRLHRCVDAVVTLGGELTASGWYIPYGRELWANSATPGPDGKGGAIGIQGRLCSDASPPAAATAPLPASAAVSPAAPADRPTAAGNDPPPPAATSPDALAGGSTAAGSDAPATDAPDSGEQPRRRDAWQARLSAGRLQDFRGHTVSYLATRLAWGPVRWEPRLRFGLDLPWLRHPSDTAPITTTPANVSGFVRYAAEVRPGSWAGSVQLRYSQDLTSSVDDHDVADELSGRYDWPSTVSVRLQGSYPLSSTGGERCDATPAPGCLTIHLSAASLHLLPHVRSYESPVVGIEQQRQDQGDVLQIALGVALRMSPHLRLRVELQGFRQGEYASLPVLQSEQLGPYTWLALFAQAVVSVGSHVEVFAALGSDLEVAGWYLPVGVALAGTEVSAVADGVGLSCGVRAVF